MKSLDDGSSIFLLLYVDDMLIATKSMSEANKLKILFNREWKTSKYTFGEPFQIVDYIVPKDR